MLRVRGYVSYPPKIGIGSIIPSITSLLFLSKRFSNGLIRNNQVMLRTVSQLSSPASRSTKLHLSSQVEDSKIKNSEVETRNPLQRQSSFPQTQHRRIRRFNEKNNINTNTDFTICPLSELVNIDDIKPQAAAKQNGDQVAAYEDKVISRTSPSIASIVAVNNSSMTDEKKEKFNSNELDFSATDIMASPPSKPAVVKKSGTKSEFKPHRTKKPLAKNNVNNETNITSSSVFHDDKNNDTANKAIENMIATSGDVGLKPEGPVDFAFVASSSTSNSATTPTTHLVETSSNTMSSSMDTTSPVPMDRSNLVIDPNVGVSAVAMKRDVSTTTVTAVDDPTATTVDDTAATAVDTTTTTAIDGTTATANTAINPAMNITDTTANEKFLKRVYQVLTPDDARAVLTRMRSPEYKDIIWACDTEVADIDVKTQGPVGHGEVVCVSVYGGPTVDLGHGLDQALWIDTMDIHSSSSELNTDTDDGDQYQSQKTSESEGMRKKRNKNEVMELFKPWFEDDEVFKVWHNYGFDRHVMFNHEVDVVGFAGDTMHMARLWDTSRDKVSGGEGYSLEELSRELVAPFHDETFSKIDMKDIFGVPKQKKDGEDSKIKVLPPIRELQLNDMYRNKWIEYSAKDAIATWYLRYELEKKLKNMPWIIGGGSRTTTTSSSSSTQSQQQLKQYPQQDASSSYRGTMYEFYMEYFCQFGEVLTELERNGIKVDTQHHLRQAELRAREDKKAKEDIFMKWAIKERESAVSLNTASSAQLQQFFFGQYAKKQMLPDGNIKTFKIEKSDEEIKVENEEVLKVNKYVNCTTDDMKVILKERMCKSTGKKSDLMGRLLLYDIYQQRNQEFNFPESGTASPNSSSNSILLTTESNTVNTDTIVPKAAESSPIGETIIQEQEKSSSSSMIEPGKKEEGEDVVSILKTDSKKASVRKPKAIAIKKEKPVKPLDYFEQHIVNLKSIYTEEKVKEVIRADEEKVKYILENTEKVKSTRDFTIESLCMTPEEFTPAGAPQVNTAVLRKLAGKNLQDENENERKWGTAFEFFGKNGRARDACLAINALADIGQIDATITNFLVPLQALVDDHSRIHCSLNLNTETGRLSSRKPNLQNQPALEKDPYKIRDAFVAEQGNTLVVADYGQLELRILAHITNCKSMLDAFASGGCFHSRTAVGMYDYIREAIAQGKVLLEWDYSKGDKPPVPLVKDKYGSERRKAKTLNFSIAYGKTVHGLAEDWGISKEEAEKTLEAWYRDRPEVKKWQDDTKESCMREGRVFTIMGRHRNLYDASYNYVRNTTATSSSNNNDDDEEEDDDEVIEGDFLDSNGTTQQLPSSSLSNNNNEQQQRSSSSSSSSFQDMASLNRELYELKKSKRVGFKSMDEEKLASVDARIQSLEERIKGDNDKRRRKDHALRAAINTPIQGSAADIVMMAMIKLYNNPRLKEMGYKLLLQIHDEVILEGPEEHRDEAMREVIQSMEYPYDGIGLTPLLVHLVVDCKSANSWYKAK